MSSIIQFTAGVPQREILFSIFYNIYDCKQLFTRNIADDKAAKEDKYWLLHRFMKSFNLPYPQSRGVFGNGGSK